MISHTIEFRTRYAETDQMGYIYYAHYLTYFEMGRAEWLRSLGFSYQYFEKELQIMMPVVQVHIQYLRPAGYDQLLKLATYLLDYPTARIRFEHEMWDEGKNPIVKGFVELAFIHAQNRKPARPPQILIEKINQLWQHESL
ncbi:MAG: thioesterase family protein [Bacteroidia bacterium]|nr:acyl-CoA thioesterase [Bacteroidia bacterium]MDW8158745.1 thioesterase family protein [Bacteroidia bacterium]